MLASEMEFLKSIKEDLRAGLCEIRVEANNALRDIRRDTAEKFESIDSSLTEVKVSQARMEERIEVLETRENTPPPRTSIVKKPAGRPLLAKGAITLSGAGLGGALIWVVQKLLGS